MTDFVVVGNVAYTAEEWERVQRKREYQRRPEVRARRRETERRYRVAHPERRVLHREYMRRWRAGHPKPRLMASLHDLACSGPTKATGCVCHKVRIHGVPVDCG